MGEIKERPHRQHATSAAIVKVMGLFSGVKVVTILASLIRNKLIAVFAGPAGLGLVILYNSIIDLVGTGTRLSIDQSVQREISGGSPSKTPFMVRVVRRWSDWLGLAGFAIMVLLSPLLSYLSFETVDHWPVFCLLAVVPGLVTMANVEIAINQGLRRFGAVAKGTVTGSILGLVVAIPLVIWLKIESIKWIILFYGISTFVGATLFRAKVTKVTVSPRTAVAEGRRFVKLGILITISTLITQAASYAFVLYLNDSESTAILGQYQSGYTLVNTYVGVVLAGIWMEYYPRLASIAHSPRRTEVAVTHEILIVLRLLTPILIVFILCAKWIIWLVYSPEFETVLPYVRIAAVGVILRSVSWCLCFVILAAGDGKTYLVTETLSAIIGLGVNIAGYYLAGFTGLGLSYIVWYGAYTVITAVVARRRGVRLRRVAIFVALGALLITAIPALLTIL